MPVCVHVSCQYLYRSHASICTGLMPVFVQVSCQYVFRSHASICTGLMPVCFQVNSSVFRTEWRTVMNSSVFRTEWRTVMNSSVTGPTGYTVCSQFITVNSLYMFPALICSSSRGTVYTVGIPYFACYVGWLLAGLEWYWLV
jgi:hypothetical protein